MKEEIDQGKQAKQELMESNLRLVIATAKRFIGRGVELEDLIQEGTFGLSRAADKYNPDRGYRFSTYASWWIRQAIFHAINTTSRTIRLPNHIIGPLKQYREAKGYLAQAMDHEPTIEDIASFIDKKVEDVEQLSTIINQPFSLNQRHDSTGEEDRSVEDTVADPDTSYFEDQATQALDMKQAVGEIMDHLSSRHQKVIQLRFGIPSGDGLSLAEVGKRLGVTRERARQLEVEAIGIIRGNPRLRQFSSLLSE